MPRGKSGLRRSDPMIGLLKANIRAGELRMEALGRDACPNPGVIRGAPTHDLAYLLNALEEDGWRLHRPCPGCCECTPSNYTDPMCDGSGER